jgi:uncharacterized protein (DUF1778 family)
VAVVVLVPWELLELQTGRRVKAELALYLPSRDQEDFMLEVAVAAAMPVLRAHQQVVTEVLAEVALGAPAPGTPGLLRIL